MSHHHDPEKATTNHEMCEALDRAPGLIDRRQHGAVVVFKGPKGVVSVSDRPHQLGHDGRKRIIRLARMAGLLLVLAVPAAIFFLR